MGRPMGRLLQEGGLGKFPAWAMLIQALGVVRCHEGHCEPPGGRGILSSFPGQHGSTFEPQDGYGAGVAARDLDCTAIQLKPLWVQSSCVASILLSHDLPLHRYGTSTQIYRGL